MGFRNDYLDYDALTATLRSWAEKYPSLVRLQSLATTPEGREVWLLVIGNEPDRVRPAAWVNGNVHASELAGSSVALAIAEDVIALHASERGSPESGGGGTPPLSGEVPPQVPPEGRPEIPPLAPPLIERLREVLLYVVPRVSPDGAEAVLTSGRYVRSVPRDERVQRGLPRWKSQDVDGDGRLRMMRVRDPAGEFVESREVPGLLVQRELEDEGPYYKLYPEGIIEHFDGHSIPAPDFFADNPIDLNRNFPWSWAPPPEQAGAGPYPMSEPESRAIVEFASRHPEIFAWVDFHTYGGVGIRPLGHAPDHQMAPSDLALYRQIEHWLQQMTGYPMVSGYHEFLYEPEKPLHGDLSDYAYHQRGAVAYVVELWDLFQRLGKERPPRFVDHYFRLEREDLVKLARWDQEHNDGRLIGPWREVHHPQLGPVEIGGIDPRVGVWNPSLSELGEVCQRHARCFLQLAALAPSLAASAEVVALGEDLYRVRLEVQNLGYLPTSVLASAERLDFNEPVHVDCEARGCALVDPGRARVVLRHLDGWGVGRHGGINAPSHQRSRTGSGSRARVDYLVRGRGTLVLRVGACRVGWQEREVVVE